MAVEVQTIQVPAQGGMDLSSNQQSLLREPNKGRLLTNFEVGIQGGYQQIKGYTKVNLSTIPNTGSITGVHEYRGGLVVCRGTGIYFSRDYTTWIQVNKIGTAQALGSISAPFDDRVTGGSYYLDLFVFGDTEKLVMTDGVSKPCVLTIHPNDTVDYVEITETEVLDGTVSTVFLNQFFISGVSAEPYTVYHSNLLDPADFTGATSGFFSMRDTVIGLKLFQKDLYVFTSTQISKATGMNSGETVVEPLADDVGCLSGHSIQEVGGDVVFLAKDGLRTLRVSSQNDTTETGTISHSVQPLLTAFINDIDSYIVTSTVIRTKNQYRLMFTKIGSTNPQDHVMFIGTLVQTAQGPSWEFTTGNSFESINSKGEYFGDSSGDVFQIETGNSFDGTDIESIWETPWFDLGSVGIRKALMSLELDMKLSEPEAITLEVFFDYNKTDQHLPTPFVLDFTTGAASYGTGTYGLSTYPDDIPRFPKKYLEGSGHVIKLRFTGTMQVDEWLLYGFVLNLLKGGNI